MSGGGDSVALMLLAAKWAKRHGAPSPPVLIVDHGLRDGSAAEAATAASWAKAAGLAAHVLIWRGRKPETGLEEKARLARYRLMGNWCRKNGIAHLMLAHQREDQAETFLLRLGRGSGVDGLSAMRPRSAFPVPGFAIEVLRPLLEVSRADLRALLAVWGQDWLEDPMNADSRFARVRLRALLPALEEAGIPPARIAAAARHLSRAREALEAETEALLAHAARPAPAGMLLDRTALAAAPREIGLRALSTLLLAVGCGAWRPRFVRLERLYEALFADAFAGATLGGCRIGPAPRAQAAFGASTVLIRKELPRRAVRGKAPRRIKGDFLPSSALERA